MYAFSMKFAFALFLTLPLGAAPILLSSSAMVSCPPDGILVPGSCSYPLSGATAAVGFGGTSLALFGDAHNLGPTFWDPSFMLEIAIGETMLVPDTGVIHFTLDAVASYVRDGGSVSNWFELGVMDEAPQRMTIPVLRVAEMFVRRSLDVAVPVEAGQPFHYTVTAHGQGDGMYFAHLDMQVACSYTFEPMPTPTPEPRSFVMLLSGLAALAASAHVRRPSAGGLLVGYVLAALGCAAAVILKAVISG